MFAPLTIRSSKCSQSESSALSFFQPKLTINAPADRYEQEADAMADNVMRMQEPFIQPKLSPVISVQRKCDHCEEEEKKAHRKEMNGNETTADHTLESYLGNLNGSGQSLTGEVRNFYEPRFGHDFSNVKVHTDSVAVKSAQSINALAYTSGNNIVFNSGQYSPNTDSGKRLLGHELTHVVQQRQNTIPQRKIQLQHIRMNSGRFVGNVASTPLNLKEDVVEAMDSLHTLWSMSNTDYAAEYPIVKGLPAMSEVPIASIPKTISAIRNNEQPILNDKVALASFGISVSAPVGTGGTNARSDIFKLQDYLHSRWFITTPDHTAERSAAAVTDPVNTATIPKTLIGLSRAKTAKVAGGFKTHDIMKGAKALSATERGKVESVLIPGATVSGTGTVTPPTPDAICTTAGLNTEIRTTIEPFVKSNGLSFRTRKLSSPIVPMTQIRTMGDIVESEIEGYFGPYLRGATSVAGARYKFGQYSVRSEIKDQSATTQWRNDPGRESWVKYWISTETKNPHHCNQTELDSVAHGIATDAALKTDIDDTINGWPAEATGGINMNPYLRDATASADEIRKARWDAFTIILHESIHHLAHPNFVSTYTQMNNDSMQILKEGFNDLFRRELWFGAGKLKTRIPTAAYNANRTVIEGATYPYKASLVTYHGDYDQVKQAQDIEKIIGNTNAKAAYFLGHTEYLGLGAGSGSLKSGGSFTDIASYHTTDPGETNVVATLAGETYAALRTRINAPAGTIRTLAGAAISTTGALPPQVKVSGVRHITVIAGDTIQSIAYQNGVTPHDVRRANAMTSDLITKGQRILIPIH